MQDDKNEMVVPEAGPISTAVDSRREALKKLGKLSLYTAPAMMLLLHSKKASAAS